MTKDEISTDRDTIRTARAAGFRAIPQRGYRQGWIEFRYRGKKTSYRGSSIGNNPSMLDSFVRYLAAEFIRETDAA